VSQGLANLLGNFFDAVSNIVSMYIPYTYTRIHTHIQVSQGLANLLGNFFDAVSNIVSVYGAPHAEWSALGAVWNNTATLDNGFENITFDDAKYASMPAILAIDSEGRVTRSFANSDPGLAFVVQVCMWYRMYIYIHSYAHVCVYIYIYIYIYMRYICILIARVG
jgi:hypothetical protein